MSDTAIVRAIREIAQRHRLTCEELAAAIGSSHHVARELLRGILPRERRLRGRIEAFAASAPSIASRADLRMASY